jgi:poly(hydroxyalkanoate) depolymerase family esterase
MIACVPSGGAGKTGKPAPLVVALHGYTQSAQAYHDTTEWDVLAGRYGFYVIYPVAPGGRSWTWFSADRARDTGDAAQIVAMVEKTKSAHDIHSEMIFATGLSAGGFETVALLADYPDVFAAGAAIAGGAYGCGMGCMGTGSGGNDAAAVKNAHAKWWNDPSTRKPRLLVIQGDKDNVVSPTNLDETVKQWTSAIGTDATPDNAQLGVPTELKGYPYSVYSKDGSTIDVASVRVKGMAHGTPIETGSGVDQGGKAGSYTFDVKLYSPFYAAKFFGIVP